MGDQLDVRSSLGLPPDASDEQVQRYLQELRSRALGNLAGPEGWTGTAEGARGVVFTKYVDQSVGQELIGKLVAEFGDHDVEYFSIKRRIDQQDFEVAVRVAKEQSADEPDGGSVEEDE